MSHYKHLTIEERENIYLFLGQGICLSEIARRIGRSRSTISREVRRNAVKWGKGEYGKIYYYGYRPSVAQKKYVKRRKNCHKRRILDDPYLMQIVKDKFLKHQWSPEQIAKRLELEFGYPVLSFRTIYRAIYNHLLEEPGRRFYPYSNGGVKLKLRHKGKKRHRKGEERRGKFRIENDLKDRPEEANQRTRLGDFEADTVLGTQRGACVLTLVDRKSRFLIGRKLAHKSAAAVSDGMSEALQGHTVHTVTPDRGPEFSKYKEVSAKLAQAKFYFPLPAHPWDRGTNENTNGLLREYLPKRKDITPVPEEYIQEKILELNLRPRKCLGWRTPYEVYYDTVLHLV